MQAFSGKPPREKPQNAAAENVNPNYDAPRQFASEFWPMGGISRAAKRGGGFKRGGFPIWTCPSFFSFFRFFRDIPNLLIDGLGIFPIRPFSLSRPIKIRAPTRNSPERVRDAIWTFPEKSGKAPGLETPRFSFSQVLARPPPLGPPPPRTRVFEQIWNVEVLCWISVPLCLALFCYDVRLFLLQLMYSVFQVKKGTS